MANRVNTLAIAECGYRAIPKGIQKLVEHHADSAVVRVKQNFRLWRGRDSQFVVSRREHPLSTIGLHLLTQSTIFQFQTLAPDSTRKSLCRLASIDCNRGRRF
jgi:hypothetical protein